MSEAHNIVQTLGGDWLGNYGLAPCPICQIEGRRNQRGLSVKDAGVRTLLTCHKSGCEALDILNQLKAAGLISGTGQHSTAPSAADREKQRAEENRRKQKSLKYAHAIFATGVNCAGTPAETYLEETRGIKGLRFGKMRNTLRFHPEVWHSGSRQNLPAMLAQIRDHKGYALGIHRTYLKSDGSGKADVEPTKMMLGPSSGGAVRFGPDGPVIALAEGIETALSVSRASRLTVWSTLSTSGLKGLILPPAPIAEVIILCADNDEAGLAAAQTTAGCLEATGRVVSIIHPKDTGADFNDVLRASK